MTAVGNVDIDASEKIKENYNEESEAGIYEPRATDIEVPVVQKTTRGRPSLGKKSQSSKSCSCQRQLIIPIRF